MRDTQLAHPPGLHLWRRLPCCLRFHGRPRGPGPRLRRSVRVRQDLLHRHERGLPVGGVAVLGSLRHVHGQDRDLPNQDGCEYGDLAGKVGQIKNEKGTQTFEDTHIFFLDRYAKNSIVFHCCIDGDCSARVACADFSYIGQ